MPLYEFRCESCGHEIEMIMAFSDPLPLTCETCGGPLKKLLSAPAVQFKGSGFYLTDYRSDSYKKSAESDSKASSAPAEKPAEKKEAPAPKSESSGKKKAK